MPIIEIQLRDGRIVEVDLPRIPSPDEVDRIAREIEAHLGIAPATPARQPTQGQQLAQSIRGTLARGWNWLRSRLGLKSPEERAREIAGPKLAQRPEALQEMARIEAARREASAPVGMIKDAVVAPENTAAERRYGSALQRRGAQVGTGSKMEPVGIVTGLGNLLGLPQRGAVAWAKQVASRHGLPGSKYASGADAFGDAAEWGALLEDLAPQLPKPVRQALSVPADILLDPLMLVPPAKVVATLAPIASKLPGVTRVGEASAWLQWQALKALHPTAAKALEQFSVRWLGPDEMARTMSTPELVYSLRRALETAEGMRDKNIDEIIGNMPSVVPLMDPAAELARQQAAKRMLADLIETTSRRIARQRGTPRISRERAEKIVDAIGTELATLSRTQSPYEFNRATRDMTRKLRDLGLNDDQVEMIVGAARATRALSDFAAEDAPERAAAIAESVRRWTVDTQQPSGWQRGMGWWKRAVTSFNLPAGWIRNFMGNFLAHYLANEPLRLSKRPLRELLQEAFQSTTYTRAGDIGADVSRRGEPPKDAMLRWVAEKLGGAADWAGRTYSSADKLAAAILAKITDKPPTHFMIGESFRLPERIEWLSRVGLIPFASWPTFIVPRLARGIWENPARWHRLSMALKALGAEERGTNIYKPLPGDRALNLEPFLPISPYMLASSEGDLPELLQRWPPLAFGRDISHALAGAPPRPAALATEIPILNALITASNYALPPTFWNALRLMKPEWFADIPKSPLRPSDYWWRMFGVGIIRNPEQYEVLRRRRELMKLRRLMRRVGVRANQMETEQEE